MFPKAVGAVLCVVALFARPLPMVSAARSSFLSVIPVSVMAAVLGSLAVRRVGDGRDPGSEA